MGEQREREKKHLGSGGEEATRGQRRVQGKKAKANARKKFTLSDLQMLAQSSSLMPLAFSSGVSGNFL